MTGWRTVQMGHDVSRSTHTKPACVAITSAGVRSSTDAYHNSPTTDSASAKHALATVSSFGSWMTQLTPLARKLPYVVPLYTSRLTSTFPSSPPCGLDVRVPIGLALLSTFVSSPISLFNHAAHKRPLGERSEHRKSRSNHRHREVTRHTFERRLTRDSPQVSNPLRDHGS